MLQVCAACFAQACTPGSPRARGSFALWGLESGKSSPGGVAGRLQAGSRELLVGAGHDPFQGLLIPVVTLQGFTFWENHLAKQFHTEATGKLFCIIQAQHWSEVLVRVIEFPLCPAQG